MPSSAYCSASEACASRINAKLGRVFLQLDDLGEALARTWGQHTEPTSKDFVPLRTKSSAHLLASDSWLLGIGIVFEPGILRDEGMYLEWMRLGSPDAGQPPRAVPLKLNFNQRSDDFYNYSSMAWFSGPKQTGAKMGVGPYVDLYGSDMYVVTFASPVYVEGSFVAVAAADVSLDRLERLLLADLMLLDHEAAILNEEGRVVVANTAKWITGELPRRRLDMTAPKVWRTKLGSPLTNWTLVEHLTPSAHG